MLDRVADENLPVRIELGVRSRTGHSWHRQDGMNDAASMPSPEARSSGGSSERGRDRIVAASEEGAWAGAVHGGVALAEDVQGEAVAPVSSAADIKRLARAFRASKVLLTAVELGLFTVLAAQPLDADRLRDRLGLHPRAARDFFDVLVALGLLRYQDGTYANTALSAQVLDRAEPGYIGAAFERHGGRTYDYWGGLTHALLTGQPQSEARTDDDLYSALYNDAEELRAFQKAMTARSAPAASVLAERFSWQDHRVVVDIGASEGDLLIRVLRRHPHLTGIGLDLPAVRPVFDEYVTAQGLADRLSFTGADFFTAPFPAGDVVVLAHILHNWDLPTRRMLLRKAYEALPPAGQVVIVEMLIDENRRSAPALLRSLNMLIQTSGGGAFTAAEAGDWLAEAGFRQVRVAPLSGAESMLVAEK
ncbi:methyltransferase [Streptomyces sp. NPDC006259]|uniref:methyltransferase n=1 Tax=Streptomyces sp. NPDC006259 TaxID=3364740 RepID=UPI0036BDE96A